ncbi:MAG TPA: serine hydrolase, partial [Clostridiaceae bacterium]
MKKIRIYRICTFISLFCFVLDFNVVYASSKDIKVLNARSAIVIDSNTGRILYEKNSEELIPMASTTKMMTALVALKYGKLDEKITISKRSANVSGSTVGYKKDEVITLKELLYGLMLRSGNDAAIAIAEGISGSVEDYLKLMNDYALQMGISGTHFETPHGLDSEFHYTTSYELALIARKAMKEKTFREIVQTKTVDGKAYGFTRSYNNINKILHLIPNANG